MSAQEIEELAAEIGENIYIDIANWHLFLADARLHTTLAERFYPMLEAGDLSATDVTSVLANISVAIGGGQRQVPLLELVPSAGQTNLLNLLNAFEA